MEDGRLVKVPNLALLTPFGAPFLIPHLKNSFFPSGEKEQISGAETSVSGGGEEDKEVTEAKVETPDNSDAILDDSSESGGGTTPAKLAETDTSSTGTAVSDVSSQTTYEESAAGTVVLAKPQRSDFKGRSGQANYERALIMYNNQKEMLNSYQKTQVKASLAKI